MSDPSTAPIYDLHRRWISEVLRADGSLFTSGRRIWTVENLNELKRDFVDNPDLTPSKTYLDKLRDQLAASSDDARQLMAELHAIHFLVIVNAAMSATKKLTDLRTILSWMTVPPEVPDDVVTAMSPGLVRPGQWALTRRDTQITWLIEFSRAWKNLDAARAASLVADPWAMRDFAESVRTPSSDSARLALLHLAHPDTFEECVSSDHKMAMVARYRDLAATTDDVDRQLLEIHEALATRYGDGFSFYDDLIVQQWNKGKTWKDFLGWVQLLRAHPDFDELERDYKLRLAERLRTARSLLQSRDESWPDELHKVLVDEENNITSWRINQPFEEWIHTDRTQAGDTLAVLWESYGEPLGRLAAFLDRLPPAVLGQRGQRLNMSTFLLMSDDPTSNPPAKVRSFRMAWRLSGYGVDANDATVVQIYERVLAFLDELVLDARGWAAPLRDRLDAQGAVWQVTRWDRTRHGLPPNWSDDEWSHFETWRASKPTAAQDEDDDEEDDSPPPVEPSTDAEPTTDYIAAAAKDLHVDRAVLDEIVGLLEDKRQVVLYGPPGTGKTYFALRIARAIAEGDDSRVSIVQFHPATTYEDFFEGLRPTLTASGQVTYARTDGPLVSIATSADADSSHRYVMVIDEINRANLPKVFGELLFLLEYRKESARTLYRPDTPFRLPENLWFIGTMNTADRSIALVDAAMRRRFHFVPFFPHDGAMKSLLRNWLQATGGGPRLADFLDAVNADLLGRVGEHLLIGPSHFMKTDRSDEALERIWTYNVFPLLEEQLWGDRDEIDRWRWSHVRQRFAGQLSGQAPQATSDVEGDSKGASEMAVPDDGTEPA